jgi:hypothetical protein
MAEAELKDGVIFRFVMTMVLLHVCFLQAFRIQQGLKYPYLKQFQSEC